MQFKWIGQDRIPTGLLKQLASVQQTTTQSGSLSNTPLWYDGGDLNSVTPAMAVGSTWIDQQTGNIFKYVKAAGSIFLGQAVTFSPPTSTGTVTSSGSTVNEVITNLTTTVSEVGNYLWFLDAVGTYSAAATPFSQSLRLIKSNTIGANAHFVVAGRYILSGSAYNGTYAVDPDSLPAVPTNASTFSVIRPYDVVVATATSASIGIALSDVTSGYYTVIQVAGLAMVRSNGTSNTVVGKPGSVLANGVLSGANTAVTGSASLLPLYVHTSATVTAIPCQVNFMAV